MSGNQGNDSSSTPGESGGEGSGNPGIPTPGDTSSSEGLGQGGSGDQTGDTIGETGDTSESGGMTNGEGDTGSTDTDGDTHETTGETDLEGDITDTSSELPGVTGGEGEGVVGDMQSELPGTTADGALDLEVGDEDANAKAQGKIDQAEKAKADQDEQHMLKILGLLNGLGESNESLSSDNTKLEQRARDLARLLQQERDRANGAERDRDGILGMLSMDLSSENLERIIKALLGLVGLAETAKANSADRTAKLLADTDHLVEASGDETSSDGEE